MSPEKELAGMDAPEMTIGDPAKQADARMGSFIESVFKLTENMSLEDTISEFELFKAELDSLIEGWEEEMEDCDDEL